ncbi:MAG: cytochrome c [Gammaproteobacteria bacterium]|nr:cytochrome c [Gammaproteobacteria bacterium]MCW8988275.1 cytochrome c [Gammaproteobacteria bacterium]MCW9030716.1 cytochrome c [Gammaproteobacteria bacterium]
MRNTLKTLFFTFIFSLLFYSPVNAQAESLTQERKVELKNLLVQDCGSCHGMTMKGGLGPALTPDVLASKSRQMIEITITHGRPGTPMPPWNTILTKQDINWIVDTLYAGIKHE